MSRPASPPGNLGAQLLFLAIGCFYWITQTPFVDLSTNPALAKPAWWSQVLTVLVFLTLLSYAARSPARHALMQPRALLVALFGWLAVTAAVSAEPADALRKVAIALTIAVSASVFLMLPRDERQFGRLFATLIAIVLGLCYFGVIFLPRLAIHQPTDFLEPFHAGLWRGLYVQKNEAAAVMVLTSFVGLYVAKTWSRPAGLLLVAAALVFLVKTDSKTSMALLPVILVLAAVFERWRGLRLPMALGGVLALNLGTVGVVAFPTVRALVAATGIDPTFTARSDIWKLALSAIAQKPLTGHGLQAFWQSPALVGSDLRTQTWATAAVDAHNAYLDAMVTAGIPSLVLLLAWVLWTPLRDFNAAERAGNVTPLTRLFLRIWLFTIFQACLESIFLQTSGAGWFTFLVAIFGLRYQARYALRPLAMPEGRHAVAYG